MPSPNLIHTLNGLPPWQPIHWTLAALTLAAVLWVIFSGQHRRIWIDRETAWWLWHWFTGGPLETGQSFPPEHPGPRHLAGRALVGIGRTVVAGVLPAVEYVRSGAPHGSSPTAVVAAGVVGALAAAAITTAVVFAAAVAAHWVRWILPLHRAVHEATGWPETRHPWRYIAVPRNRTEGVAPRTRFRLGGGWRAQLDGVIVRLPPNFDVRDQSKERVTTIVRQVLDIGDAVATFTVTGRHSYVQFRPRDPMPSSVYFSDPVVRELVEKAKPSKPLLGLSRGGKVVDIDLDTESPHVLLSVGTGGGKSAVLRAIAAQLMVNGAEAWVVDVKRHSQRWLREVPGTRYAREISEIHRSLCDLWVEADKRNKAWDNVGLDDKGPKFQRIVVLCEELNGTMDALKQWWKDNRETGDPVTSPAIVALRKVLFMGRAVRIHVLAVAQMATANDLGGPAARENFAIRILRRHTVNNWKMLVPECAFIPADKHPGRSAVCYAGVSWETQMLYLTEHEARDWVNANRVVDVASRETPLSQGKGVATVATLATSGDPIALGPRSLDGVQPVTLAEASSDRGVSVVELRHDALRQAARRDPEFPPPVRRQGVTRLYSPTDLQRWEINRPRRVRNGPSEGRNEVDEVDRMEARGQG